MIDQGNFHAAEIDVLAAFEAALRARDIIPPAHLIADGKLHRCDAAGRHGKDDAAYLLHLDDYPAGGLENHRDGVGWENWVAKTGRKLDAEEREAHRQRVAEARAQRDIDVQMRQAAAAKRANSIWERAAPECNGHPYLAKKHLGDAHGARLHRDKFLVVPVRDFDGAIMSLQFIDSTGDKQFLTGGRKHGGCCVIGDFANARIILVCEGFATAVTLHEATGYPVVVAFDAVNLLPVAAAVRKRFPAAKFVLAADDDHLTRDKQGNLINPGLTKAREAAAKIGGHLAIPDFGPDRPDHFTDFNDLSFFAGHDRVREIVEEALATGTGEARRTFGAVGDRPKVNGATAPTPTERPWPVMAEAAYHGVVGDAVMSIKPHTEADPVGVLAHLLIEFGNAFGRRAYYGVDGARHYPNEFGLTIGRSSKARKGTAARRAEEIMGAVDPDWYQTRVENGLSTGEGLIHAVRDAVRGRDKKTGEETVIDEGVTDKRLLVHEEEFGGALQVMKRHGNTLSPRLREAWDTGNLGMLVKNNRERATGAHISILGHITLDEYRANLDQVSMVNGFSNRFLHFMVRRWQTLPFGGMVDSGVLVPLAHRFREALTNQSPEREVSFDPRARRLWIDKYDELSAEQPGLYGAITARAEAHTVRLALNYALLDQQDQIGEAHLKAALAVWDYCAESARYIFGDALGDPIADTILGALRQAAPDGMTRWEITNLLGRNQSSDRLSTALALLLKHGKAQQARRGGGPGQGRPIEVWVAI